jgi:hypothetical protein
MTRLWPGGERLETWGGEKALTGFNWQGESHRITDVCNRWRIHTRWWEPEQAIWREYLKVVTDTGLLCLIYQELPSGGWLLARLYD